MTVTTTTASQTFQGNGVATAFPCAFEIFLDTDVNVYFVNPTTGVQTPAVLNTDYTAAGAGASNGFTVNTTVPVPTGTNLYVVRALPLTQLTDFTNQGAFFPNMHEQALDRLCMLIQQIANYSEGLNITMPPGLAPQPSTTFPVPQAGSLIGWDTEGTALVNTGPTTGVGGISDLNVANNAAIQGTKLAFLQAGVGAPGRTVQDKQRERVSVKDFGAKGDGITDDTSAFLNAVTYLSGAADSRGGTLHIPAGTYVVNESIAFTANADGLHNVFVQGDGPLCTVLDFAGCAAGTDGVTFGAGSHFGVRDVAIDNAPGKGIVIGRGLAPGASSNCSYYIVDNVRVQGCGGDGVFSQASYAGSYTNIWAKNNSGAGINFAGFHTSISVGRVEASGNILQGFSLNGIIYSRFAACGADENGQQGYAFSNLRGVVFSGCGAESNQRDGFFGFTSDASAVGTPSAGQDIRGVVLSGCFAISNSAVGAGLYATFLGLSTANSRAIEIVVEGGSAAPTTSTDAAFILAGTSGVINFHKNAFDDTAFIAADGIFGTATVQNQGVAGRSCTLQLGAPQTIATATDTAVNTWNATPIVNDLGATVTTQTIAIPRGVHKVRVSAAMGLNMTGGTIRTLSIYKNGAKFLGFPIAQVAQAAITDLSVSSGALSVSTGDTFEVHITQDSGASATLSAANSVWFTVEAVS